MGKAIALAASVAMLLCTTVQAAQPSAAAGQALAQPDAFAGRARQSGRRGDDAG